MSIYSANFFKDDFTENKNRFKNQEPQEVHKIKSNFAFKVKKIEEVKTKKKDPEESIPLSKIVSSRMNTLKEYFYRLAGKYFNEEIV